jgi:hypothetical protein
MPRQKEDRRTTRGIIADDRERGKERDRDGRTVHDMTTHDAQAETATGKRQRLVRERMTTHDMTSLGTQTETGRR